MSTNPSIPEGTPIAATDGNLQKIINNTSGDNQNTNSESELTTTDSTLPPFNYEDYKLFPDAPWPPPIFIRKNVSPHERFYIENRWHAQWTFFDKKASENKRNYIRLQLIIGVGSVTVPVLVGIRVEGLVREGLYLLTVFISLAVAIAAAIENINKYGENWRSYRQAAEDLKQEKSLYDIRAGRYADIPAPFARFVERTEEIIAQQNGRWIQSTEKQQSQASEQIQDILDDDDGMEPHSTTTTARPVQSATPTLNTAPQPVVQPASTVVESPSVNAAYNPEPAPDTEFATIPEEQQTGTSQPATTSEQNQQAAPPPIDIG